MFTNSNLIRLALPKGRMETQLFKLLDDAGIGIQCEKRGYRPLLSSALFETKLLKPQSIVKMLQVGSRDLGFTGADWVQELGADLVELLDTELDPVRVVLAAPQGLTLEALRARNKPLIASEMENLTLKWANDNQLDAQFVRSYGATEVYPPEDADCIIDIAASGATLKFNGLEILDTIMTSSTRLYANRKALENPRKREGIEELVMLLQSVLDARKRVMIEMNVAQKQLEALISILPCMRGPTVATLHGQQGYAVKAAVPKKDLATLIPQLKRFGATDLVVNPISQLVA